MDITLSVLSAVHFGAFEKHYIFVSRYRRLPSPLLTRIQKRTFSASISFTILSRLEYPYLLKISVILTRYVKLT